MNERHEADVCFHDGEAWKVICTCGWEAWNRATELDARAAHGDHTAKEDA